jgi:lambda family phage portal protein
MNWPTRNWIDRLVLAVAPRAGFERLRYRAAADLAAPLRRGYEGAKGGRRGDGWVAVGTSANAEIFPSAARLRNRARQLVRDNFYGERAVRIYAANVVATGVTARANTGRATYDKKIDAAWDRWCAECDADGRQDFAGLQALAVRATVEAGEMLLRFRPRRSSDGLAVPLQLQLLEPDFLDTGRYQSEANGNLILQGIEFDKLGRRVAYWLFDQHPGDVGVVGRGSFVSRRIDASEIVHLYRQDRIGQIRGVTWFAPVLMKLRDYDDYSEAELVRKKIAACLAAFVTTPDGPGTSPLGRTATGAAAGSDATQRIESFEPGMIGYLKPGEDVKTVSPPGDASMRDYASISGHEIAAGLGVTYEDLTGDLSQVNYSSYRAGRLIHRRLVEQFQWTVMVPQFLAPIRKRFLQAGFVAGAVPVLDDLTKWTFPRWESIDPVKDAAATRANLRLGTLTWGQAVAAEGEDPEAQFAEIVDWNKKFDDAGIVFDGDPRKVTNTGQTQSAAPAESADPAAEPAADPGKAADGSA